MSKITETNFLKSSRGYFLLMPNFVGREYFIGTGKDKLSQKKTPFLGVYLREESKLKEFILSSF
jgi:hypothetical protein